MTLKLWHLQPLLLLVMLGRIDPVSGLLFDPDDDDFPYYYVETFAELEDAVANVPDARDTDEQTRILVGTEHTINFDDLDDEKGLDISNKRIAIDCYDYSDANKCIFNRTLTNGRFFMGDGPLHITFRGIMFKGGNLTTRHGGVFRLEGFKKKVVSATFIDCDFVSNNVGGDNFGGAIFLLQRQIEDKASRLTLIRCTLYNNSAKKGGAVYVEGYKKGRVRLDIRDSNFSSNVGRGNGQAGNDVKGYTYKPFKVGFRGDIKFDCFQTSTTSDPDFDIHGVDGTCSPPRQWDKVLYEDFSEDLGMFREENSNAGWTSGYSREGTGAARIKKNGKFRLNRNLNLRDSYNVRVTFWFYPKGMENGDSFFLEYSPDKGNKWKTVKKFSPGLNADFANEGFYKEVLYLPDDCEETCDLDTTKGRIRFRCNGSGEKDWIYIDEVKVERVVVSQWVEITFDNFEDGWGSFAKVADGTMDAARVSDSSGVPQGNAALRIRDNSGRKSSVFHDNGHDVSGYLSCRVSFMFSAHEVKKEKGFVLEYSSGNGSGWTIVKRYVKDEREDIYGYVSFFSNNKKYSTSVNLKNEDYDFTTKARIRFRAITNGNDAAIYIDKVAFECHS